METKEFDQSFEKDSSPSAWKDYRDIYKFSKLYKIYDIENPVVFSYVRDTNHERRQDFVNIKNGRRNVSTGKWYNYIDKPIFKKGNRLNAIRYTERDDRIPYDNSMFYQAQLRLGGETDFNFIESSRPKENKYGKFLDLLRKDYQGQVVFDEYKQMLDDCKSRCQSRENFSLMQVMGNLQGYKGKLSLSGENYSFDRFDSFVAKLAEYYAGNITTIRALLEHAEAANAPYLISYLNQFRDVYDYCKEVYVIFDVDFINEIISSGNKSITTGEDVVRYMKLAIKYWNLKKRMFEKINYV